MAFARIKVKVEIDCDTTRLFGKIADAIAYMQEIANAHPDIEDLSLEEIRTGYEDWYFAFTYERPETDEEYNLRARQLQRQMAYESAIAKADEARRKRREQYEQLRKEFG